MKKLKSKAKIISFIMLIISFFVLQLVPDYNSMWFMALIRAVLSAIIVGTMFILAGKPAICSKRGSFKEAVYLGKYSIFVSVLFFIFSGIGGVYTIFTGALPATWISSLLSTAILCLFVGIFEEALFRGLIFNSLLLKRGDTKKGIYIAMFLASLIFGIVHILPVFISGAFLDPIILLQSLLKTIQTGMCGFLLAAIYLKTGSLWGIAFIHGLNDFLLMVWGNMLSGAVSSVIPGKFFASYVDASGGNTSFLLIIVYLVTILLSIPFITKSIKIINSLDLPQYGIYK